MASVLQGLPVSSGVGFTRLVKITEIVVTTSVLPAAT